MKNIIKISGLAMVCVLCAAVFSSAYGASSVRALGGAGAYDSASNAAAARSGSAAINSMRAASVRATTGSATKAVAATASTGSVRTGSVPRLSAGSYLSGGKTIQGGGSIKSQSPGASSSVTNNNTNVVLQDQIDSLQRVVNLLQDSDGKQYSSQETDDLLKEKQDVLTAGDNIEIKDNVVSAVLDDYSTTIQVENIVNTAVSAAVSGANLDAKADKVGSGTAGNLAGLDSIGNLTDSGVAASEIAQKENAGNKVDSITVGNQNSSTHYPSVAAVVNAITAAVTNKSGDGLGSLAYLNEVGTNEIKNESVTKDKLATDVKTFIEKADTAVQPIVVPAYDSSDYALVINNGAKTWVPIVYP
ncbi:MAG: hypothetical protein LBF28_00605 [Rickettsiales bacterium]|jgi:hypothetical protein|nr:hypothetical protein [Rickettsiales bacterium]